MSLGYLIQSIVAIMRDGKKIHGFLRLLRNISMLMCKLWVVLLYFALIDVWHAYIHPILEFNEMDIPYLPWSMARAFCIFNIILFVIFVPLIHQH